VGEEITAMSSSMRRSSRIWADLRTGSGGPGESLLEHNCRNERPSHLLCIDVPGTSAAADLSAPIRFPCSALSADGFNDLPVESHSALNIGSRSGGGIHRQSAGARSRWVLGCSPGPDLNLGRRRWLESGLGSRGPAPVFPRCG